MTDAAVSTISDAAEDPPLAKLRLEIANLQRQNEKLSFEIDEFRHEATWVKRVKSLLPLMSSLVAVLGFWFGIYQYLHAEQAAEGDRLKQQQAANETFRLELKRETARPFWEKQLSLYLDAVEQAAVIATSADKKRRADAEARFWVLYWGPLAAVEDVGISATHAKDGSATKAQIEARMVKFGALLKSNGGECRRAAIERASLELAHAVRDAVGPAFDLQAAELAGSRLHE